MERCKKYVRGCLKDPQTCAYDIVCSGCFYHHPFRLTASEAFAKAKIDDVIERINGEKFVVTVSGIIVLAHSDVNKKMFRVIKKKTVIKTIKAEILDASYSIGNLYSREILDYTAKMRVPENAKDIRFNDARHIIYDIEIDA
jgi:hypothetical protein